MEREEEEEDVEDVEEDVEEDREDVGEHGWAWGGVVQASWLVISSCLLAVGCSLAWSCCYCYDMNRQSVLLVLVALCVAAACGGIVPDRGYHQFDHLFRGGLSFCSQCGGASTLCARSGT